MLRMPKNLGVHLSRPRRPFWGPLVAILDFAGGERVSPLLLGRYFNTSVTKLSIVQYVDSYQLYTVMGICNIIGFVCSNFRRLLNENLSEVIASLLSTLPIQSFLIQFFLKHIGRYILCESQVNLSHVPGINHASLRPISCISWEYIKHISGHFKVKIAATLSHRE